MYSRIPQIQEYKPKILLAPLATYFFCISTLKTVALPVIAMAS